MVTQEKWDKGKGYLEKQTLTGWITRIQDIQETTAFLQGLIDYKFLEKIRFFFCHLAMTYPILFPYLKGFHLTLCTHLSGRDKEGWK